MKLTSRGNRPPHRLGKTRSALVWTVLCAWAAAAALATPERQSSPADTRLQDFEVFLTLARPRLWANFLFEQDEFAGVDYTFRCRTVRKRVHRKSGRIKKQETTRLREVLWTGEGPRQRVTPYERGKPQHRFERPVARRLSSPEADEIRDRIWDAASFAFLGEEKYRGVDARLYSFTMPEKVPNDLKTLAKTSGRLWFDKATWELVKVEGEYRGTVVLARGGFASGAEYRKGTRWSWELQRTEDHHWVLAKKLWKYPRRGDDIVDETECTDFKRFQ